MVDASKRLGIPECRSRTDNRYSTGSHEHRSVVRQHCTHDQTRVPCHLCFVHGYVVITTGEHLVVIATEVPHCQVPGIQLRQEISAPGHSTHLILRVTIFKRFLSSRLTFRRSRSARGNIKIRHGPRVPLAVCVSCGAFRPVASLVVGERCGR